MTLIPQTTANETINNVRTWVEQKYGCTVVLNLWEEKKYSACTGYPLSLFIVSYTDTVSALHELGHAIIYCELGREATNARSELLNEFEAWRIAEDLAQAFGIEFNEGLWQEALGSYCIKAMVEGLVPERKIIDLLWG